MPKQPRNSPLVIVNHEFTVIELNATSEPNPTGELSLNTDLSLGKNPDDELSRFCELTVKFYSLDENKPAPYSGKITINGVFQISKEYAEHRRDQLIEVTGPSILYGACREMVANLTARSTHGLLSLPSVSFFDPSSATAKKAAKKSAKKTTKKAAAKRTSARKSAKKKSD
jgi:preprotein translocase subunit SecB